MSGTFFEGIAPVRFEGADCTSDLAFRHYDPDEMVMGKRMEDHLRFAITAEEWDVRRDELVSRWIG